MHGKLAVSAALVGLLAQITTATTCTSSNATPIEQFITSGGGGGGAGSGVEIFLTHNPFEYAVKKRTPDAKLANIALAVAERSAGSVTCSATEMCFSVQKVPFCLDITTGTFHDGVGTTGNALTGDYTLGDGRKGNLYNGPFPQPTGAAAYSAASTTGAAGAGETASSSSKAGGTVGGSTTAAAPTETGAGQSSAGQSSAAQSSAAQSSASQSTAASTPKGNGAGKVKAVGAAVGGLMGVLGAIAI